MTTLTAAGQATAPFDILRRESADWSVTTTAGFGGRAWLQERLDDGTWRNRIGVRPGQSGTVNGPAHIRVWIESMDLGDDLTATFTANDDVLFSVPRADGRVAFSVRTQSGVSGIAVGAVSAVNGKVGNVALSAADVGADPVGSANAAKLDAIAEATTRLTQHEQQGNPHGLTAGAIGLGSVNNTADIDKPVSTPQQQALDALDVKIAGKLDKGASDGVIRGIQNGALVTIPGTSGASTEIKTESEWAAISPGTAGVIYHIIPDPPPPNIVSSDFGTGWDASPGYSVVAGEAVLQGTAAFTLNYPLTGLAVGSTYEITFTVKSHISGNLTPGFTTDGTLKLHTTTRQGTAGGVNATYTVQFAPTGGAPSAFGIRCNLQDGLALDATISNPIVTVIV